MDFCAIDKMSFDGNSNIFDLLLDRDIKGGMDPHEAPWLSSDSSHNFKEEMFHQNEELRIKNENEDFSMDELLLGSCFDPSDFIMPFEPKKSPSSDIDFKEEELDDLVGVPFDSVMTSLDTCFESASDSGVSADNAVDLQLSPSSSGSMIGDSLGDNQDSTSDVSFSSDLGSLGSVADSPISVYENSINNSSSGIIQQAKQSGPSLLDQTITQNNPSTTVLSSTTCPLPKFSKSILQNNVIKSASEFTKSSQHSPITIPSISTRTIKLDLSQGTKNNSLGGTTKIQSLRPILKRVRIDGSAPSISHTNLGHSIVNSTDALDASTSKVGASSTFVVTTQSSKAGSSLLKNGAFLRASNGKSILLPVNVKDLNQVRTIKIINPNSTVTRPSSGGSSTGGVTKPTFYTATKGADGRPIFKVTPTAFVTPSRHGESVRIGSAARVVKEEQQSLSDEDDDEYDEMPQPNQRLILTDEERKLMRKEGLVLPTRYPLTKQEERDLKRIRRKIRNKISAQDSRKRKKEYMDDLEERVKKYAEENKELHSRIDHLEKQNEGLLAQLKKFQNSSGTSHYSSRGPNQNHASTALMMLMLSAALIVIPSLRPENSRSRSQNDITGGSSPVIPTPGRTRSLLEAKTSSMNLDGSVDEFCEAGEEMTVDGGSFNPILPPDHDYSPCSKKPRLEKGFDSRSSPGSKDWGALFWESEKPPDGGTGGMGGKVMEFLSRLVNPLAGNWSRDSSDSLRSDSSSSVIVKMTEPRLKEIELE